jgi:cation diffusion facilitator family transporter
LVLEAEGRHLLSDVLTSVGTVLGLALVALTNQLWLDNAVALAMALLILVMGFRVMRRAVGNLMDEADDALLNQIAVALETNRAHHPQWVDVHHLRVQQFGEGMHVDCHLTLPWYYDLNQTRQEIRALEHLLNQEMPAPVEASIRADPCVPQACPFCPLAHCPERKAVFVQPLEWTPSRIQENKKHGVAEAVSQSAQV